MEYLFHCRDKPGSWPLRRELTEAHWTFMDGYVHELIARGPTMTDDGETVTGSIHVADLPDAVAARVFAYSEPNYRAGVYEEDVFVRRWRNVLGRTMWDFPGGDTDRPRYLVIGHGRAGATPTGSAEFEGLDRDRLIAYGPLLSEDDGAWAGTLILAEVPDRAAAEALLAGSPHTRAGLYERVEIHRWRFGGRS